MQIEFHQIDAFTSDPFSGNPAVVCLLDNDDDISDDNKLKIAAEVNQPMTAFVSKQWSRSSNNLIEGNPNSYKIRYFTPTQEFFLCGHATIATTFLLSKTQSKENCFENKKQNFYFETNSCDKLIGSVDENNLITISFPIAPNYEKISLNDKWTESILQMTLGPNIDSSYVEEICFADKFILIRLKDSKVNNVYKVEPDFNQMNQIVDRKRAKIGFIVTQKADFDSEKVHFFSRVFTPWIGVNEDPVCGNAHVRLVSFWSRHYGNVGQTLIGKQCSQRPGIVRCRINGDWVELSGNAVVTMKGVIRFK